LVGQWVCMATVVIVWCYEHSFTGSGLEVRYFEEVMDSELRLEIKEIEEL